MMMGRRPCRRNQVSRTRSRSRSSSRATVVGASSSAWRDGQVDLDERRQYVGERRRVVGAHEAPRRRHEQLATLLWREVSGVAGGDERLVDVEGQRSIRPGQCLAGAGLSAERPPAAQGRPARPGCPSSAPLVALAARPPRSRTRSRSPAHRHRPAAGAAGGTRGTAGRRVRRDGGPRPASPAARRGSSPCPTRYGSEALSTASRWKRCWPTVRMSKRPSG